MTVSALHFSEWEGEKGSGVVEFFREMENRERGGKKKGKEKKERKKERARIGGNHYHYGYAAVVPFSSLIA